MNYTELTNKLVSKALDLGADAAEVFLETGRNLSIQVLNGEIDTIEEAASAGVGFRVIVDGKSGFSHCNDFSEKSMEETLKMAIEFAKLTTPDENNVLTDNEGITEVEGLFDPEISSIPMEQKIDMALKLEKMTLEDPRISKSSGASFGEAEGEVFIANSNGISKSYKTNGCSVGVSVVAEKGEQKNTGGEYCSRRFFKDLTALDEIAKKAADDAAALIDPQMIPTQKAPVIVHPDAAGSLIRGIISALNGERVLQGASFLKDSMDKSFASPLLTIVDDGTRAKGMGSAPFDGEGVPTQKRVLVEKGVVKGFIYNTKVAKRAGVSSTGNASRRGFDGLPGIGTHNIYVEPGDKTPEEIIASTKNGLMVTQITGYGINAVNGNFSGGASGFWIENGKIKHPVKGVTIAGTADEILNAIDMMGNDLDLNKSFSVPTFRVKEMMIGGA
ncbi:TldD/PmbA family protein [Draconibacterium sp. IB214405]|uniref:TldD/PmbA family protein n=1 Tax=Draconibacterium sp. IB214405 TaxID=3097352 RepID=UPI002A105A14|nr:TldD/PmbA family protein [Draconibacterium sp. IB214405]MDX8338458.1 TldD/PmbA family protein [Draconibacterium sp. IB214405]